MLDLVKYTYNLHLVQQSDIHIIQSSQMRKSNSEVFAATAKGALIITPQKVIVTTPGADNKKVL